MKKFFYLAFLSFFAFSSQAQKKPGTYWNTQGGLKAGMNTSNIRFGDDATIRTTSDAWNHSFTGGGWVSFALGKKVSLQPELTYSRMGGNVTFPVLGPPYFNQPQFFNEYNLKFDNVAIPLLLKVQACKIASLYVGPQLDLVLNAKANVTRQSVNSNEDFKDSITKSDLSLIGGIQLFPQSKLHVDFRYQFGTNDVWENKAGSQYNQNFQVTLGLRLFGKKTTVAPPDSDGDGVNDKDDKCPTVPGVKEYDGCPIPDTDGDGINDKEDKCPTVAGTREYQGCPIPDTDGDGINDKEDKCPTVAGTREYQGCPIPDTDGDGINDKEDKCPTVAGVAKYQGCPIPDSDGDGVNDEIDRCPNLAGSGDNNGCPVVSAEVKKRIEDGSKNILFITGSYTLSAKSYKTLDEEVKYMKDNPALKLVIDGHTDNVGSDEMNQKLSLNRANAVKDYFTSKGISESRITINGFGETMPIADNKTAAGRQKNRRVEMKMDY